MTGNVLVFLSLFQTSVLLIKENIALEIRCCGRFGPPYFTAKAKVTATAQNTYIGDYFPIGNEQEAECWGKGTAMGREF